MRPIKVLILVLPMALTFFSCSQDADIIKEKTSKCPVNLTMEFTLSSDIKSRATRPLTSVDAWQRVTDMRVYVFRSESEDGTFTLYYPEIKNSNGQLQKQENIYIPEFDKFEAGEDNGNDGIWKQPEDEQHTYTITPMLPDGYYRFLAVGYDDPQKSPVKLNWNEDITTWETALLINNSGTPIASEIFTGYPRNADGEVETIHVDSESEDIYVDIICRRAVAGVLLYLKNIPARYTAENSWNADEVGTGIISSGLNAGTQYDIYEVALVTVGYNPICNAVTRHWEEEFVYDNRRFKITRLASIALEPGEAQDGYHRKVFPAVGNFVMPSETYKVKDAPLYANYEGGIEGESKGFDKSLYLCFFTKTGTGQYFPLRLWPVKLVRSYTQDEDAEDLCAGDLMLQPDNPFNYNLVANHLYCLGMYKDDKSIDQPVDLEKEIKEHVDDALTIVVVGSWQYEINIEM